MSVDAREAVVADLLAREVERCRAISQGDWAALEALLRDDYHHTHATGVVQDKSTYIQHIRSRPRATERGKLRVQVYARTAVMAGRQINTLEGAPAGAAPIESQVLQGWIDEGAGWQLVAAQSTRIRGD
jgi:uncharacterized protein DUF4440